MHKSFNSIVLASLLCISSSAVLAAGTSPHIPAQKQTQLGLYMSAKEAYETKKSKGDKVLFIDIRTPEEYEYVGHATVADMNIPYLSTDYSTWDDKKNNYPMVPNSNFLVAVADALKARKLDKDATIILMCRSGDRSAAAANLMAKDGYSHVYSVYEGFEGDMAKEVNNAGKRGVNGWRNAGLPWEYTMDKSKVYTE